MLPLSLRLLVRSNVHGAVAGRNVDDFRLMSPLPPRLRLRPPDQLRLRLRLRLQLHFDPWKKLRL